MTDRVAGAASFRIEDYAFLSDTQSGALVSREGCIDWLCLPRFDSGACFAALLGGKDNGTWTLTPQGKIAKCERRYRGDTLILETDLHTSEGAVRYIDFMKWCLECHRAPENFVRPRAEIYNLDWQPPPQQRAMGLRLVRENQIDQSGRLTDCSTCHR